MMRADRALLIVTDGEPQDRELESRLHGLGYRGCVTVASGRNAVEAAAGRGADLAVIDLGTEDGAAGIQTAEQLREELGVPVIYLTEGGDEQLRRAEASRPHGLLLKPVDTRQLDLSIRTALAFHDREARQRESNRALWRTNGELRRKTRIMDTILNSIKDGVVAADGGGRILFANSQAERIVGSVEDMKPGDLRDASERQERYGLFELDKRTLVPTGELPLVRALLGKATDDKEVFVRNGGVPEGVYVSVTGRTLWSSESDEIEGGVVFFRDVTREKEAENDLQQTLGKLNDQTRLMQTVFDNMEEGVLVSDTAGNFLLSNPRREQIVGMKLIASEPDDWPAAFGAFYLDRTTQVPTDELPLVRAMRGEATEEVELFIRNEQRPEGAYIRARGRPLMDGDANVVAGVAIFSDITKYKETEAELERTIHDLQAQAQQMEATFNGISDGLAIVDTEGEILNVNPTGRQIAGVDSMPPWQARKLIKWGTYYYPDRVTLMAPDDLPLNRIVCRGETVRDMDIFVRNDKRPDGIFVRLSARPLLHADGRIRGGVIIFRDVTDQVEAEEALTRAFAQGRLEIIDTVLHNVGNAISSVTVGIGTLQAALSDDRLTRRLRVLADGLRTHRDDWVDYLTRDPQGRKVVPYIGRLAGAIAAQHEAMARTVARVEDRAHHIADIIRTQKALDKPHMIRKVVDLEHALGAAVRVLRESLDKRGITVEIRCDGAPREIRIEESQFHQMMVNLIKNAIEAIDDLAASGGLEGPPRIRMRACRQGDFLQLDVEDNGIGIDSKNARLVFAAGYSTKNAGSGLGLHSAANFVIGAGGQIRVLSDGAGKGATLRVMLRLSSIVPAAHRTFTECGETD